MRTFHMILIASMMIFAVPAVAADDPSYEDPDPADVAAAAGAFSGAAQAAGEVFANTTKTAATEAATDGQNQTLPASRLATVAGGAGDLATSMVGAASTFAGTTEGWAVERAENKRNEAFATVDALIGVAVAGINAGDQVAGAAVGVVCAEPLVNSLPDQCEASSLINVVRDQVTGFGNETGSQATSDRTADVTASVKSLIGNVVELPDN